VSQNHFDRESCHHTDTKRHAQSPCTEPREPCMQATPSACGQSSDDHGCPSHLQAIVDGELEIRGVRSSWQEVVALVRVSLIGRGRSDADSALWMLPVACGRTDWFLDRKNVQHLTTSFFFSCHHHHYFTTPSVPKCLLFFSIK
jgi:hypothetical protein